MKFFQCIATLIFGQLTVTSAVAATQNSLALDPEELRLDKARAAMPQQLGYFSDLMTDLSASLTQTSTFADAELIVIDSGEKLWKTAVAMSQSNAKFDDRPLYWARLIGRTILKQHNFSFELSITQRTGLLQAWEDNSRGLNNINYTHDKNVDRVFLTGFDPFLLDRNIDQSNPSGVTALMLDGKIIEFNDRKFQIETVMIPVRFDDFDQGLIERILTPLMAKNAAIDLITTVSMGRQHFDLERFPGKRRSATISGNRNVITGASPANPLLPLLDNKPHQGAEFVELSLPVALMQQAPGPFKINDNHQVTTLAKGKIEPQTLVQLTGEISVQGSGGSYLSNEISYRSVALRDKLGSAIAVGHIHTPRIKSFEPQTIEQTVNQITEMLKHASTSFK